MNTSYHRLTLDLNAQDSMEYVPVRKGDTAKGLSVRFAGSGTPYAISEGTTAVLAARKPDGTYIYADCTVNSNTVTVTLPAALTAAAGMVPACIRMSGDGAALISPTFIICVTEPAAPAQT